MTQDIGSRVTHINLKSRSNFLPSFFILPRPQRQALMNFYAFARQADDAVDESTDPWVQTRALHNLKTQVLMIFQAQPTDPLIQLLQNDFSNFNIPYRYLLLLIEGCEMDIHKHHYADFGELYEYCYRVAGIVGLACMRIFGLTTVESEKAAVDLGMALQLTNIIRDVKEDFERGRIYIPQDELKKFTVATDELAGDCPSDNLKMLLEFQAQRAQQYYDRGFAFLNRNKNIRSLKSARLMASVYQAILHKIARKNFQVLSGKVRLSPLEKIVLLLRVLW